MKAHSALALTLLATLVLYLGCSKNETTSVSSLSALPAATGPVVGGRALTKRLATSGRKLTEWHNNGGSNWGADKSGPMCQTGEMITRLLSDASQPDKIMCYVGAMEANGFFTASYDGTDKYYVLSNPPARFTGRDGRPMGEMPIKFNITKTDGSITDFKMWMCMTNSRNRVTSQMEYVSASLNNGQATVTSVGVHDTGAIAASQRTVATGNFNSSGNWTSKTITNTGSFGGGMGGSAFQHKQQLSLTQNSENYILSGYFSGYHGGVGNTQSGSLYSKIQGLNLSTLATAALGDGTTYFSFTFPDGHRPTFSGTRSWTGDNQTPITATEGSYYADVNNQILPESTSITAPSFSGSEVWDCDAGSETVTTINMGAAAFTPSLQAALEECNSKYGFNNNNPTSCGTASFLEPSLR